MTTDENTPVKFLASVETSLTDTYTLIAQAPAGWTVTIDASGNVTATPAPGLQGGTYPIEIIAQSTTNLGLLAQTVVDVTVNSPTQPGITLSVQSPDPLFTVPFDGAQVPTAFSAPSIANTGPANADTYNVSVSNLPAGFTLLDSGTSVTVPAGQNGILGVYLQPTSGQPSPPMGTQLSFTVTATSTTNAAITQTQTETFTVPAIDAVTVTASPATVATTPGVPVSDTITLTNVGNVTENNITLTPTSTTGLMVTTPAPVTLAPGQSTTASITLTPGASTPLNSLLQATLTATYGPSATPLTQTLTILVQVVVPGADAIANASVVAANLGNTDLANRLSDLSTDLTNLVQDPTSAVYNGQATAAIASLAGQVAADPFLAGAVGPEYGGRRHRRRHHGRRGPGRRLHARPGHGHPRHRPQQRGRQQLHVVPDATQRLGPGAVAHHL